MAQPSAEEQYLLELINAERKKVGAQPLAFDSDLNEAAELHSEWMLAADTFSHTGSGGSSAGQRMSAAGYKALTTTGTLSSGAYYAGAAAHDSTDRIIYNASTGALSYDADGTGATAAVQFAQLSSGLALTNQDFLVI